MATQTFGELLASAKTAGVSEEILTLANQVFGMGLDAAAKKMLTEKLADMKAAAADVDHAAVILTLSHESLGSTGKGAERNVNTIATALGMINALVGTVSSVIAEYNKANGVKLSVQVIDGRAVVRGGKRTRVGGAQFDWSAFAKNCAEQGVFSLWFPQGKNGDGRIELKMRVADGNDVIEKPKGMVGADLWATPTMVGKHVTGWKSYGALAQTTVLIDGKHIAVADYHSIITGQEIEADESENEIGS